jgi:hypothetical protein
MGGREGQGTSMSYSLDDVAAPLQSGHFLFVTACDCMLNYELRQPK